MTKKTSNLTVATMSMLLLAGALMPALAPLASAIPPCTKVSYAIDYYNGQSPRPVPTAFWDIVHFLEQEYGCPADIAIQAACEIVLQLGGVMPANPCADGGVVYQAGISIHEIFDASDGIGNVQLWSPNPATCSGYTTAVTVGGIILYYDERVKLLDTVTTQSYSTWVYVESNGKEGLQRGGYNLAGDPEWCWEPGVPDTLIF
jgi:hypothetical protein